VTGHPRVLVSLGWPVRGGFAMVGSEGVVDGAFRPAVHFSSMHAKRHRARATAPGDHEQRGDGDVLEHLAYGLEEGSRPEHIARDERIKTARRDDRSAMWPPRRYWPRDRRASQQRESAARCYASTVTGDLSADVCRSG